MPVQYKDFNTFMKEMGTLNAYTPGATTTSSGSSKRIEIVPKTPTTSSTSRPSSGGTSEAAYFNAFSGALGNKISLENKRLDASALLENRKQSNLERQTEAAISGSRADRAQKSKDADRADRLAREQIGLQRKQTSNEFALGRGAQNLQGKQIDYNNQNTQRQLSNDLTLGKGRLQNERLGIMSAERQQRMADATKRYGYDMEFKGLTANNQSNERMQRNQLAFNRYDTDSRERLGMRGYDVEELGVNKQFDLGMENIASSERLGMRGYDVEDSRIASNERLGMEGYATERYGMDKQFDLGMANVASTERLGMRGYDVEELGVNKQFELGLDTNRTNKEIAQLQGALNLKANNRATFAQLVGSFG